MKMMMMTMMRETMTTILAPYHLRLQSLDEQICSMKQTTLSHRDKSIFQMNFDMKPLCTLHITNSLITNKTKS